MKKVEKDFKYRSSHAWSDSEDTFNEKVNELLGMIDNQGGEVIQLSHGTGIGHGLGIDRVRTRRETEKMFSAVILWKDFNKYKQEN